MRDARQFFNSPPVADFHPEDTCAGGAAAKPRERREWAGSVGAQGVRFPACSRSGGGFAAIGSGCRVTTKTSGGGWGWFWWSL